MIIIYILIPINLVFLIIAICFFFWGVKKNQFDNLDTISDNLIYEDKKDMKKNKK